MEIISGEWGKAKTFPLPFITYGATDFLSGVTLAEGDVQISKDGGDFENIETLPTILGKWMLVTLSADEMKAGSIAFQAIDQTATKVFEDQGAILSTNIKEWMRILFTLIESQRGSHSGEGEMIFWDPENITGVASDANSGLIYHEPKLTYNYNGANGVHDLLVDDGHQIIKGISGPGGVPTTVNEYVNIDKSYNFLRCDGRNFLIKATHNEAAAILLSAEGVEISGLIAETKEAGSQDAIAITGDFARIKSVWVDQSRGNGILIDNASSCILDEFLIQDAALGGSGHAVHILGDTSITERNLIGAGRIFSNGNGGETDGIRIDGPFCLHNFIHGGESQLIIHDNTGWGVNEVNNANETIVVGPTVHIGHNTLGTVNLIGSESTIENSEQWAKNTDMQTALAAIAAIPTNPVNVISALSGSISVDSVKNGGTVLLYQNTVMAIPIDLAKDMTGRSIFFSAVRDLDDPEYSIPNGGDIPKEVTADFNLLTGEGLLSFTAEELDIESGTLEAEVHSHPTAGGDDVPEMIFKIKLKDHPSNL